jgi:membrane protein
MSNFLISSLRDRLLALARPVLKEDQSGRARFGNLLARLISMVLILVRGFRQDRLRMQAAALTYSTLISMVPFLVVGLALLRGLGYGEAFLGRISQLSSDLPPDFQTVLHSVLSSAYGADFGKLGGVGGTILLIMVVQMISRIEASFNAVWGVTRSRPLFDKISHYLSICLVVPLLFLAATTLTAQMKFTASLVDSFGLRKALPFLAVWLAIAILNLYLPNTRVKPIPAAGAALFSALVWLGWFRFYMAVQPGVVRSSILYGTLAAIPIFLVWLYAQWLIILVGAKLTYAWQNFHAGEELALETQPAGLCGGPRQSYLCCLDLLQQAALRFQGQPSEQAARWPQSLRRCCQDFLVQSGFLHLLQQEQQAETVLACPFDQRARKRLLQLIWLGQQNDKASPSGGELSPTLRTWDCDVMESLQLSAGETEADDGG